MTNRIGENINKLRKHHNLTQQRLSELLGISVAAVSKWETGTAYPDIELLPKIATIFNVSIDYLFDFHLSLVDNPTKVIESANHLFEIGQKTEAILLLSEALLRYPNNMLIKFNHARLTIWSATEYIEVIKELEEVINNCENREITDESYYLLSTCYISLKEFDKAIDAISKIRQSPHINTGLSLLWIYMKQGNFKSAIKQFEFNIFSSLCNIHANTILTDELFKDDFAKAVSFYEMAIGTFKAYSGNNPCRFDVYISTFYERAAYEYVRAEKYDQAIHSLKFAVQYAHSFDNLADENDLPQFDSLNISDTAYNKISNQKLRLLNTIESNLNGAYKYLTSNNDFIEIVTTLKNSL
jgi:Predicted transcriptional regulators